MTIHILFGSCAVAQRVDDYVYQDSIAAPTLRWVELEKLPSLHETRFINFVEAVFEEDARPIEDRSPVFKSFDGKKEGEIDMIRCEWTCLEIDIVVTETPNLLLIDLPLEDLQDGKEWKEFLTKTVRLSRTDLEPWNYSIALNPPKTWSPGDTYSNNPEVRVLERWTQRVNVVCDKNRIRVVLFKGFNSRKHLGKPFQWFEKSGERQEKLNTFLDSRPGVAEARRRAKERAKDADNRAKERDAAELRNQK